MKTTPIGIRFEQEEFDKITACAKKSGRTFSDIVREGVMHYLEPDKAKGYLSLAALAAKAPVDMELSFGQFLDDFAHAKDKAALIEEEPSWAKPAGRWPYDFAATAHKLAHDNNLPVPQWVLKDDYVAPEAYYAFNTRNPEFQEYLRKTTPREFQWHNLFLGENILSRA
ncbi:MAG TPA: hypothetical protein H9823_09325 [Candidatus Rubneribacter avistercoris]|nr:hypothetical protein [Candidatus Rubneribacter avistercoris]